MSEESDGWPVTQASRAWRSGEAVSSSSGETPQPFLLNGHVGGGGAARGAQRSPGLAELPVRSVPDSGRG